MSVFQPQGRTGREDESPSWTRVPNWPSLEAHFAHDEVTGSSRLPQSAARRRRLMDTLLPRGSGRHRPPHPLPAPSANKCNSGRSLREIKARTHAVVRGRPPGITHTEICRRTRAWDICVTRNTRDPQCILHVKC